MGVSISWKAPCPTEPRRGGIVCSMHRNVFVFVASILSIVLVVAGAVVLTHRGDAPWSSQGTLVIALKHVPEAGATLSVGLGFDDVMLVRDDGTTVRVSRITRHVVFDPADERTTMLVTDTVPAGTYTGFVFTLSGPETRNAWQGDEAPEAVALYASKVRIPAAFTVRADETTALLLGVETTSAMKTDAGERYYLPVVRVEARSGANVVESDAGVTISEGMVLTNATYGMDWSGTMKLNTRAQNRVPVLSSEGGGEAVERSAEPPASAMDSEETIPEATSTSESPAGVPATSSSQRE